jgi:hypothetical protein
MKLEELHGKIIQPFQTTNPPLVAGLNELKGKITHRRIPILYYKPEIDQIHDEFQKILIVELAQDTGNRRRYADSLWYLVVSWLGGIAIFLAADGILTAVGIKFLDNSVMLALIGGTTASVLALFTIVAKFLFPSNEDLFGTVARSKLSLTGSKDPQPEHTTNASSVGAMAAEPTVAHSEPQPKQTTNASSEGP